MLKKFQLVLAISLYFICQSASVSANGYNSLAQQTLLKKVVDFVNQEVNPKKLESIIVKPLPLDSRVRIKSCPIPLSFEIARKQSFSRQFPVKVSCNGENHSWKLYAQVKVTEYLQALITTEHIAKGETIDADKVTLRLVEKHRIKSRGTQDKDAVLGGRAMRNIPRGYQISSQDVCLVCKGDNVAIVAKSGNMTIKTNGTAVENGSLGESIKVKNTASERIVKGIIGELRQVYVNL